MYQVPPVSSQILASSVLVLIARGYCVFTLSLSYILRSCNSPSSPSAQAYIGEVATMWPKSQRHDIGGALAFAVCEACELNVDGYQFAIAVAVCTEAVDEG